MRLTVLIWVAMSTGCIGYNPECIADFTPARWSTRTRLDLRPAFVRTQEAPIGNLVADAIFAKLDVGTVAPDFAVINSGAIRARNECGGVGVIEAGPLTRNQIEDTLPFGYEVVLVEASKDHLLQALERSVAFLGDPGRWGSAARFLQVSHLRFRVDCARVGAVSTGIAGRRIETGSVEYLTTDGANSVIWAPVDDSRNYRIVTSAFIAEGNAGYGDLLADRDTEIGRAATVVDAVLEYVRDETPIAPIVDGRIRLGPSCGVP